MRIRITAGGIYDGNGAELPLGTEVDVEDFKVTDEGQPVNPHPWGGRFVAIGKSKTGKKGVNNDGDDSNDQPPAEFVAPTGPFTAKEASPGWWGIFDGKGEPVGKKARKADLDGFNELSDDDKNEFAIAHAKAAFEAEQKKA